MITLTVTLQSQISVLSLLQIFFLKKSSAIKFSHRFFMIEPHLEFGFMKHWLNIFRYSYKVLKMFFSEKKNHTETTVPLTPQSTTPGCH